MKLSNLNYLQNMCGYNKLSSSDIMRLPLEKVIKQDTYESQKIQKANNWKKAFTAATFGLTALCIAYRNNFFNPIKREAIAVVNSDKLKTSVQSYLVGKVNNDTYAKTTTNFLKNLINNKNYSKDMTEQAKILLNNSEEFNKLMEKVNKKLNDDVSQEALERGYTVTLLDKLKVRIETYLTRNKQNDLPIKNQTQNIINDFFNTPNGQPKVIDELFENTITTRSQSTIETFLKDMVDKKEFAS